MLGPKSVLTGLLICVACTASPEDGLASAMRSQEQMGASTEYELESDMKPHPYIGMWVTADGHIRQELLPSGRYDEARGNRQSAYQGRYEVTGDHIEYWDDTGFTADGVFVDGNTLHHGGMVFFRQK